VACAATAWLFTRIYLAKHRLHLVKGMAVTASRGTSDAGSQPFNSLWLSACASQCLRRHEVACSVIGIGSQERIKFRNRSIGFALVRQFHRDPITGKAVLWVERENLSQSCKFIHCACVRADPMNQTVGGFAVLTRNAHTVKIEDEREFRAKAAVSSILAGER
jgi:hypothetical protein